MILKTENFNGKQFIGSIELYRFLRLTPDAYSKWCTKVLIQKGVKDYDYIDCTEKLTLGGSARKIKSIRLYITLDFAIGITYRYDTYLAKSLRKELVSLRDLSKS